MAQVRILKGVAVTPGLGIGPAYIVNADANGVPVWSLAAEHVRDEIERLEAALRQTSEQFLRQQKIVSTEAGDQDGAIFGVHRMVLEDPAARSELVATIRDQRINAEAAVQELIQRLEQKLARKLGATGQRSYAADITDPWRSVLDVLARRDSQSKLVMDQAVVLAAAELTPQVMTFLERERLLGVITETGGRFSHGAVLARAFGVPCVVGLPNLLNRLEQGMLVAVDGDFGTVQLKPDKEDVEAFLARRSHQLARRKALDAQAGLPSVTPDEVAFKVQVNIESLRDFDTFEVDNTDGIGLLRTEFMYMERSQFPSEEEQYRLYRRILERMHGMSVTLRTLDIGGDKRLPYFKTPHENNPALGWKGLRISLEWRDLLRVQLRAAMRAGRGQKLRILLPMVTALEEVRETREIFNEVRSELLKDGYEVDLDIPLGIMIEVPSTLFVLPELLREVDFVSVGTNDLVQYLLAVDRDNARVATLYEPCHPSVLRALDRVAYAARQAKKPCSVCGDIAGDPAIAILLLGLGYDSVSVAPHFLPTIKHAVRRTNASRAREMARSMLEQSSVESVFQLLSRMRAEVLSDPDPVATN